MIRFLLLGVAMFIRPVSADTTLVYHLHQADDEPLQQRLLVSDGKVAIYGDPNVDRPTLVYDRSQSALTFINHSDRQFTVISEKWAKQASDRFKLAMKRMNEQMQKQLENMSPQQRSLYQQGRMMMPMMQPMMGGSATTSLSRTYMPSFGTQKYGDFSCRRVDVMEGVNRVAQLCVAEPAAVQIPQEDYQTLRAMLQTIANLSRQGGFNYGFKAPEFSGSVGGNTHGIVVQQQDTNAKTSYTLQSVGTEPVEAANFSPPRDYLEAEIPLPTM